MALCIIFTLMNITTHTHPRYFATHLMNVRTKLETTWQGLASDYAKVFLLSLTERLFYDLTLLWLFVLPIYA